MPTSVYGRVSGTGGRSVGVARRVRISRRCLDGLVAAFRRRGVSMVPPIALSGVSPLPLAGEFVVPSRVLPLAVLLLRVLVGRCFQLLVRRVRVGGMRPLFSRLVIS